MNFSNVLNTGPGLAVVSFLTIVGTGCSGQSSQEVNPGASLPAEELHDSVAPPDVLAFEMVAISGGSVGFAGTLVGDSLTLVVRATNTWATGVVDIRVSLPAGAFEFEGGTYPGLQGDCGTALGAGESCYASLVFAPQSGGVHTSTISARFRTTVGGAENLMTFELSGLGIETLDIQSGNDHTCAFFADGSVRCYGSNDLGQLGGRSASTSPFDWVRVTLFDTVSQIAVGSDHTCALVGDQGIRCWGSNSHGQLWGTPNMSTANGIVVVPIMNATGITAYGNTTCATLPGRAVQCWGEGFTDGI